jgi:hypothetical protein
MFFHCLNLETIFIINILLIKTKVFVLNWIKICDTFLMAPCIINENIRNVLLHSKPVSK